MGLKDFFGKKRTDLKVDKLAVEIQKVDVWLMGEAPVYNLKFDPTVPTKPARAKYLPARTQMQKYDAYRKKLEEFITENFYGCTGDMYSLYELYQWVNLCLTTGFRMVQYAPSSTLPNFVNYDEAVSYYNQIFQKTEGVCRDIVYNMKAVEFELPEIVYFDGYKEEVNSKLVQYENGIKMVRDCKELEQCEQLLGMLAECLRYASYLFDLTDFIYKNVPYIILEDGRSRRIRNWEKTYENLTRHINIENRAHGLTTEDEFLHLIE